MSGWRTDLLRRMAEFEAGFEGTAAGRIRAVRRLKRKAHRLLRGLIAPGGLCTTSVDGMRLWVPTNTAAFQEYVVKPFEPLTVDLFRQAVRPGDTVVDVGAQFGYFSLLAAQRVGPEGHVYAFEPVTSNFALLRRNIDRNRFGALVQPIQEAVGDRRSRVEIIVYEHSDSHSMYRHPRAAVREVVSVPCVTIDEFLGPRVANVVKVDIEGHEARALDGMRQTVLRSSRMVLFMELNPFYLSAAGTEPESLPAELQRLGFEVQLIDERSKRLRSITGDDLAQRDPSWYANLYCTRKP